MISGIVDEVVYAVWFRQVDVAREEEKVECDLSPVAAYMSYLKPGVGFGGTFRPHSLRSVDVQDDPVEDFHQQLRRKHIDLGRARYT